MRKIITIGFISFITMMNVAHAQTEQGGMILGANLANINIGLDGNGTSFGISPSAGYFVMDNLAVGASLPISYSGYSSPNYKLNSYGFGLGLNGRYYIPLDKFSLFGGAGIGIYRRTIRNTYVDWNGEITIDKDADSNANAKINGGLVYFLNKNIGLEGSLNVGDLINPGTSLSLALGLQIYFNKNSTQE